jgi:pimeloyl-ACP methyl ester carboxylesterase
MHEQPVAGYVPVNGVEVYWERRGEGGVPLVAVHGGFGVTSVFGDLLDRLAARREVVAIELQGHGHTRDIDRPFTYEAFGEDLAGVIEGLGHRSADLLGYSLGAGASLRCAIQHADRVRRLALVSAPCRRDGWFPGVLAGMEQIGAAGFERMRNSPIHRAWAAVAPDPGGFPALMDKTGELLRRPYDWTEEVRGLTMPALLVYADADSIPPSHAAEFFALLGGGLCDAGWDGSHATERRLAILPGRTHYDILGAPELASILEDFLGAARP